MEPEDLNKPFLSPDMSSPHQLSPDGMTVDLDFGLDLSGIMIEDHQDTEDAFGVDFENILGDSLKGN